MFCVSDVDNDDKLFYFLNEAHALLHVHVHVV